MSTLVIEKDRAVHAYKNADASGKQLLSDLFAGQVSFVKTWKDILTWPDAAEVLGIDPDAPYYNTPDKKESSRRKIEKMTSVVNSLKNGRPWLPDYRDENQRKWTPIFVWDKTLNGGSGGFRFHCSNYWNVRAIAGSGSAFCFSDSETSDFAGKAWSELYIDATF